MPYSALLGVYSKATKQSYGANFVMYVCVCNYNFIYAEKEQNYVVFREMDPPLD